MKPIHVVGTIVRIFAVCLFIYIANLAIFTLSLGTGSGNPTLIMLSFLVIFIVFVVSCCLWFFPISISRKLTGIAESKDNEDFNINGSEFATICFFSLGVYFLYGVIGEGIYWLKILNDPMFQELQPNLSPDQKASLWAFGLRSIFVVFLLFGNRALVKLFQYLRHAG